MSQSSESEHMDDFELMSEKESDKHKEVIVPSVGLEFQTIDEMCEVCLSYARKEGFSISKRSSKKGEGVVRYITLTCGKNGRAKSASSKPIQPQPTSKTGCQAKICGKLNRSGKYEITSVLLEHNHILSPGKARHFRCYRKINARVARQLEISDMAGIKVNRNYKQHVVAAGGRKNVPFNERDCRNYIQKKRAIRLGEGDAAAIQRYFLTMQKKSNGFVFSMDLDDEGCLRNVFWADRRSREAYKEFGDVVTFDTTYLTNRYGLPFAPFVGINHHGQSILLGCGLLSNEDTESFSWLFRTWLDCMDGKAPDGIITDQDQAMRCAIEEVFPNTRHRWCLWHIMKKIPQKLSSYKEYKKINTMLHDIVYDAVSIEEFESKWKYMIDHYSLWDNRWLDDMYRERKRWVPIFVKPYFWAGMYSIQRSESMNAFFDGYVNAKTSLKVFVEQYNVA